MNGLFLDLESPTLSSETQNLHILRPDLDILCIYSCIHYLLTPDGAYRSEGKSSRGGGFTQLISGGTYQAP